MNFVSFYHAILCIVWTIARCMSVRLSFCLSLAGILS